MSQDLDEKNCWFEYFEGDDFAYVFDIVIMIYLGAIYMDKNRI